MSKINLALFCGGQSTEHQVSLLSSKNVMEALDREKYRLFVIAIDHQGQFRFYPQVSEAKDFLVDENDPNKIALKKSDFSLLALTPGNKEGQFFLLDKKEYLNVDVVFPVMHGSFAEDGKMQGLLEMMDLAYVGPDVLGSSIAMDKDVSKKLLIEANIPVADFFTFRDYQRDYISFDSIKEKLALPLFIKPANSGSSVGINKVDNEKDFNKAVEEAFQFDNKILIETGINGRELECSVLGNFGDLVAGEVGEIVPSEEHGFYSYNAKYIDEKGAALSVPADISSEKKEEIQHLSKKIFTILECEGMARIDFFMTEDGELILNEINTIPGFTKISMYPKLLMEIGMTYSQIIDQLIDLALKRFSRNSQLQLLKE